MKKQLKFTILKLSILSLLLISTLWIFGSTLLVKAQIANSPDAYILDKSETPIIVTAPIKGELISTFYKTTYSRRTGKSADGEVTSALHFERAIFPLTKNDKIKSFVFVLDSNSDNGVAAEEIARVIKQIPQPTTVIIKGEVGRASYIIASAADKIVMEENAMIKNIGDVELVVNRVDFGTVERECATTTNTIHTLANEGCTSFLDAEQIEKLKEFVLDRAKVQQEVLSYNRNISIEKVQSLINKELSAQESLREGLVDEIGSQEDFLREERLRIGNFRLVNLREEQ